MLGAVSAVCTLAFLFFAYFGVRLVWFALTFDGEGSLGHVGVYIGAGLYPILAILTGIIAWKAGKAARTRLRN